MARIFTVPMAADNLEKELAFNLSSKIKMKRKLPQGEGQGG